ncbi:Cystathionine gamma-lyase [Eumeta japonica]|uniref:cystathionine gamma-lyase n=1 Tax=Eumeta variegata TaxID=151549 RepID=A0A4C1VIF6_EUMVA|nr:Cystathionine gamma-lyase [Eumeta japonica]
MRIGLNSINALCAIQKFILEKSSDKKHVLWECRHKVINVMSNQGFLEPKKSFATLAIHAGQDPDQWNSGAVVPPIVTSTTFKQPAPAEHTGFEYGRSGNPSRNTLEECMAALEGGKHGLAFASGLGATTVILSLLSKSDHILSSDDLYGGTNRLFRDVASSISVVLTALVTTVVDKASGSRRVMARMGIDTTFTDFTDVNKVEKEIRPNTKLIWIETPTNPILKVADIAAISKVAKKHGDITVVVDNTFLTSYLQRPLDFGADIVMYSLTKYMNGHSDVIMGAAMIKRR